MLHRRKGCGGHVAGCGLLLLGWSAHGQQPLPMAVAFVDTAKQRLPPPALGDGASGPQR